MKQHRYQVKHVGCGHIEVVAVWSDVNDNDRDDEIKKFAHECHTRPLGEREQNIPPCDIAVREKKPEYEIIKRRF